ncbi:MAG TPA: AEC family transporter [Mogibacterium sp.]|nr:AEC family transporter [Mogibacterium sp.]
MFISSLSFSLRIISPIILIVAIGYFLRVKGVISRTALPLFNRLIFYLFLPVTIFHSTYHANLKIQGMLKASILCVSAPLLVYILTYIILKRSKENNGRKSVIIHGISCGGIAMVGLPLATFLFEGEHLGIVSIIVSLMATEVTVFAILSYYIFSDEKIESKKMFSEVFKSPFTLSIILGLLLNLFSIELPGVLLTVVDNLSRVTAPFAFVVLGAGINLSSTGTNRKVLLYTISGKLIILPLTMFVTGLLFGLSGPALVTAVILAAAPASIAIISMASEMNCDVELASDHAFLSTFFSGITIFLWIFIFRYFGFF